MIAVVEMTRVDAYTTGTLGPESALSERVAGVENVFNDFSGEVAAILYVR